MRWRTSATSDLSSESESSSGTASLMSSCTPSIALIVSERWLKMEWSCESAASNSSGELYIIRSIRIVESGASESESRSRHVPSS